MAVIDHLKTDGNLGVRPVSEDGRFLLNSSAHWPMAERLKVPEEIQIHCDYLRPMTHEEIPYR